jgi:hypothetical protein
LQRFTVPGIKNENLISAEEIAQKLIIIFLYLLPLLDILKREIKN